MKKLKIQLKKDYNYACKSFKIGAYTFIKEKNIIIVEKAKEMVFKNNNLLIKIKNERFTSEENIPVEAIENYEVY